MNYVDASRAALALKLTEDGASREDIWPIVMAVHPFDFSPVPQRAYEKAVRKRLRECAKQQRQMHGRPFHERAAAARSVLADYRALAFQHGEVYYQTRFDEFIG